MGMVYVRDRSKKPKKLNAKQRQLQADWDELMKKYPPMKETKRVVIQAVKKVEAVTTPRKAKYDTTVAAKAPPKVYTGGNIVGIATMHKSNLTPIFNKEAAKEVASMRR